MTKLDESIQHCIDKYNELINCNSDYAIDHLQLMVWLTEVKLNRFKNTPTFYSLS